MTGWTKTKVLGRQLAEVCRFVHGFTREAIDPLLVVADGTERVVKLPEDVVLINGNGSDRPIVGCAFP